jgi:tetratricopeptide (TPR) repeat protein
MTREDLLQQLIEQWHRLRAAGRSATPRELCKDCPDLQVDLTRLLWGDAAPSRAGRYDLEEEIGRGGMGIVFRARDPELQRSLAVNVLLPEHQGDTDVVRRFHEEARITGQLQHPGIPPIFDVGFLPDGRPFFAMKLVEGRTLDDLLGERPTPAHDLPRFLGIFEQVCQTLAYAHSRLVIHRDLKPANVMVGAFGEVQVMNWSPSRVRGAALPSAGPAEPSIVATLPSYYLAPEQARGEIERINERSDVFGLGAILCVILTGQPPYVGASSEVVQRLAIAGDLAATEANLDACGADAELVALAQRCLAAEPEERFPNAQAVAVAVSACRRGAGDKPWHLAQLWAGMERKHRRALLVLAAILLASAVGAGAWWHQQIEGDRAAEQLQQDAVLAERTTRTERELHQALDEARLRAQQATASLPLLYNELGNARINKGEWDQAADAYRQSLKYDPKNAFAHFGLGTALSARARWDEAADEYRAALASNPKHVFAKLRLGIVEEARGRLDEAIACYREATALDDQQPDAPFRLGMALRQQGKFDEALAALERSRQRVKSGAAGATLLDTAIAETQRILKRASQLDGVLGGHTKPADAQENLDFALLCQVQRHRYHAAVRFFADAFHATPAIEDDLAATHRYNAACAAALAGCGRGNDAGNLPEAERMRLRKQALTWLSAELAARLKKTAGRTPADRDALVRLLTHWRRDPDFAGVRDEDALARLPAEEQAAWRHLWADVQAALE